MPVSRSKQLGLLRRREQVADLYVQGWTQASIADRVGVSQSMVCDDLKAIRAHWRESAIRDFDGARELELQKLDRLEREAWDAWDRSKKPLQAAVVTGEGADQKTRKTMKNQHGDARFLEIVHKCVASRRAILGLDAPLQVAPVMPDGTEPYRLMVDGMSENDLRVLKRLRDNQTRILEATIVNEQNGHG